MILLFGLLILALVLALVLGAVVVYLLWNRPKLDDDSALRLEMGTPAAQLKYARAIREARLHSALLTERTNGVDRQIEQELSHVLPRSTPIPAPAA